MDLFRNLDRKMRKGGNFPDEQIAPGAQKYFGLYFAPNDIPGAYEIARFSTRDAASEAMESYMAKELEFKFYNGDTECSSLNVSGYYSVSEHWDSYLK